MDIQLDELDEITQGKYLEFKEKVEELLKKYQQMYSEKYELIKQKVEHTNGNWDTSINLVSNDAIEAVDISQLLAFEYCLATERITQGKVTFEQMAAKLFEEVQKFRIGNPIKGMDDECLYSKAFDDKTAIPVTSKLYRVVRNAGAQYLDYFKDGKMTGAVFIYEKRNMGEIAVDEEGKPVLDMATDGINFKNLQKGQSLLSNLRQTAFHEWNHCSEKEILSQFDDIIPFEYKCADGKTYRNYDQITDYVTYGNPHTFEEPIYVMSHEKGRRKPYYINENGEKCPMDKPFFENLDSIIHFDLQIKHIDSPICISYGLTTKEPDGTKHNIVTEGFVEYTARTMVKAIDPDVKDIDEGRYFEQVEMAKEVISARDISMGAGGKGQTFADFLTHSSKLKRDLETRAVVLENGIKTDGLHYIADYADKAKLRETDRWTFISNRNMNAICSHLGLTDAQKRIAPLGITEIRQLSKEQKEQLITILMSGTNPDKNYVDDKIEEFIGILERENEFFEGISHRLGYTDRTRLEQLDTEQDVLVQTLDNKKRKYEQAHTDERGNDTYEKT